MTCVVKGVGVFSTSAFLPLVALSLGLSLLFLEGDSSISISVSPSSSSASGEGNLRFVLVALGAATAFAAAMFPAAPPPALAFPAAFFSEVAFPGVAFFAGFLFAAASLVGLGVPARSAACFFASRRALPRRPVDSGAVALEFIMLSLGLS